MGRQGGDKGERRGREVREGETSGRPGEKGERRGKARYRGGRQRGDKIVVVWVLMRFISLTPKRQLFGQPREAHSLGGQG